MSQQTHRRVLLSVNVDHVATLREARRVSYPDPLAAAALAEEAGAGGITVHLREDRRHIQERDLERLRQGIDGKLNLEIAGTSEMLEIAERVRPDQVTLVPERPDEVTTEGGLDLTTQSKRIERAVTTLAHRDIAVSLFVDPDEEQLELLSAIRDLQGFEINTDVYTRSTGKEEGAELEKIRAIAAAGSRAGLAVYAGHGLTISNVGPIAAVPEIEELNIGHSIVSRATLIGMKAAVAEILAEIEKG